MAEARTVYIAGGEGFTEGGRRWLVEVLHVAVGGAGFEISDPWDLPLELGEALRQLSAGARTAAAEAALKEVNLAVYRRDRELIDRAEQVLAVLDGPGVDDGTAAEVGYAAARGKRIVGLRTDLRDAGDNWAGAVNLMIEGLIHDSGGRICRSVAEAVQALGAAGGGDDGRAAS